MIYRPTNLVAECFESHNLKYRIEEVGDASIVEAGFSVDAGPQIVVRFISKGESNDVAVRVFGLVCKVPEDKRAVMLETCNRLSREFRFFKFYLDKENSMNVEADIPQRTDDCCVGECCFELFVRLMKVLNDKFPVIAQALYTNPSEKKSESSDLFRLLNELKDKPIDISDAGSNQPN